jgi:hypothetical protein
VVILETLGETEEMPFPSLETMEVILKISFPG